MHQGNEMSLTLCQPYKWLKGCYGFSTIPLLFIYEGIEPEDITFQ